MKNLSKSILNKFSNYTAFTYRDVKLQFKDNAKSSNLRRVLSYLKKSGKIYPVTKGVYSTKKDDVISGFAFKPFYYGGLSALMIRDLVDDQVKMEIMTPRRLRRSKIEIFGDPAYIAFLHHLPVKYFFGFDIITYSNIKVPVSDPEKTLIDLFYYKRRMSIQDYAEVLKVIKPSKIRTYLKVYDNHTKKTVLNFIKKYKKLADSGGLDNPY